MSHFSFKKKCLWFMFAVLPFVSACQSNSSGSEPRDLTLTPPAPDAPTDTNPVKPANPENPVEAQRWCRVEDWGKFQVVMRAVAGSGQMQLQYLRITPNAPTIHPVSEVYPYEMRGPVSFPEKKKWVVTYWTDTTKIKGLYGYDKQKEIVEKKLVNNPALFQERSQFAPEKAITVVTRSLSDEDEVIRQFYPCEQYSPYFSRDGAVRSSIEMALYLAWSNKGFVGDENQRSLADSMKLNLPVEEVKLDVGQLDRSQWCSWHQIQPGVLLLRTLTFNGGQYLSNIHTQHFTEVGSEADTMAYLTNNARYSVLYNLSRPQGRIAGKKKVQVIAKNI